MKFEILSLNIGQIQNLVSVGGELRSSFAKVPVEQAYVHDRGLDGDEHADLKHHGGHDKALCVFSAHHIPAYENLLGKSMNNPGFGENLTVDMADEEDVFIGDVFTCGEIKVQVTQPRQPCSKLGLFHHKNSLVKFMARSGWTGFYLRVLNGGLLKTQDTFTLVESDKLFSIATCNDLMFQRNTKHDDLDALVVHPALSSAWKDELRRKFK